MAKYLNDKNRKAVIEKMAEQYQGGIKQYKVHELRNLIMNVLKCPHIGTATLMHRYLAASGDIRLVDPERRKGPWAMWELA